MPKPAREAMICGMGPPLHEVGARSAGASSARAAIPVVVLGGSDREPGEIPDAAGKRALATYKGMALRVAGRPLVELVIARLRACGGFAAISIAGPARVYAGVDPDVGVIDTDADVGTNLRAAIDGLRASGARGPLAFLTCDVLPDVAELRSVLCDYHESPSALWYPLVRAPEDPRELGAFGWKPDYVIRPEPGAAPVKVLPGHLLVADPAALRLELLYRLIGAAYDSRNRPVHERRRAMLRKALTGLLHQDVLHVASLRLPSLTWTVLVHGLAIARELRTGELTLASLERHVGRIALAARHRRREPDRAVRLPIVDAITLAKDVDTYEEARALGARVESEAQD